MSDMIFDGADLALAAYADLSDGETNTSENIDSLIDADMTRTQAEQFAL